MKYTFCKQFLGLIFFTLLLKGGINFAQTTIVDTTDIHHSLGNANYFKSSNADSSLFYYKQAFLLTKETSYENLKNQLFFEYAYALYKFNEFAAIENLIILEKDRIIETKDSLLIAEMSFIYGSTLRQLSKLNEAKQYLNEAIKFSSGKKESFVGNAHVRLGLVYRTLSDYEPAIYNYFEAINIFEYLHDSNGLVKSYGNLVTTYTDIKDKKNAAEYCLKALRILEDYKNLSFEAILNNKMGVACRELEQYEKSLEYFEKASTIADEIGDLWVRGNAKLNISHLYADMGQIDLAIESYEESLKINKQCGNFAGEVATRAALADLYNMQNIKINIALKHIDTSLNIALENDLLYRLPVIYHIKAELLYQLGRYRNAFNTLVKQNILKDSVFDLEKREQINNLRIKYETEKKESRILALENETLQKDLDIKRKNHQKNLISGGGIGLVIIMILLFYLHFQRTRKDGIIKEKEILRLVEEKKALAAKAIVEGQEEERKRVARELHDGIGVLLSNVKMQFSSFMDKSPGNKEMLNKASNVLNQASMDVRRISHNMMPGNLSKFGLIAAIEDLFEEVNESGKILAEMTNSIGEDRFSENKEIMLYRIIQELVNNTLKHAEASNISLNLNKSDGKILVTYADNGKGFDVGKTKESKSMGLKNIHDRIKFLGGELSIESESGKGVSFIFDFPI